MSFWDYRVVGFLAAVVLTPGFFAEAKPQKKSVEAEVQMLANFPALQRLGAKGDREIRATLERVSAAYRQVGYAGFAKELPRAGSLIGLFATRAAEETPGTLRQARATVRRLDASLAGSPVIVPENAGESLPDYLGIARTFVANAERALANAKAGKNVANTLRKNVGPLEVRKFDGEQIAFTNPAAAGVTGGFSFSFVNVGSTGVSGTSIGSATISAGSLNWIDSLPSSIFGASLADGRWIAFPPTVEIPAGAALSGQLNLSGAPLINGVEYPAGTRLIQVAETFVVPAGAVELETPVQLVRPAYIFSIAEIDRGGVETLPSFDPPRNATPTPSPTPAP